MNKIVIRQAEAGDIREIRALLNETWHATYDEVFGPGKVDEYCEFWHSIETLAKRIEMGNTVMLVAHRDDLAVATACASHEPRAKMTLKQLYVKPDHQGTGIGSALYEHLLELMPPFKRIELEVEPGNKGAIAFYQKHGFQVTGMVDDCGGTGDLIKALLMTRNS